MDGACSKHGRYKECIKILVGNLNAREHLEDLGANGGIILECILRK